MLYPAAMNRNRGGNIHDNALALEKILFCCQSGMFPQQPGNG
jgi:hypothetical protein